MRLFLAFLLISSFSFMTHSETTDWQLEQEDTDLQLKIYTREISGSNLNEFKGELIVETTLTALTALLLDSEAAPQWMHECETFEVIEQVDQKNALVYFVNGAPWPVSDRDAVISSSLTQNPETLTVRIDVNAVVGKIQQDDDYVRIPRMNGFWSFSPLAEGKVKVVYQVHAEPGGSLPAWLANSVVVDTPYYTMSNMLDMLKLEKYQKAEFSFIQDNFIQESK
jgi:hypothetical protein